MFEGFEAAQLPTRQADIFVRTGGTGPPLLLLHGFPQNHLMWHAVAPRLRDRFSLVIPDLRGYGDSTGPAPDPLHVNYSKRVMAADMVEIMAVLGHSRFMVAGHDRGARVAYRMTLDDPDRVIRLAVLDILPTLDVWERMRHDSALRSYHWLFLAQPAPVPERLIQGNPDFYLEHLLTRMAGRREAVAPGPRSEYARQFRRAPVVEAMCEDYRAGATVDADHDRSDRAAGRRIACPTLVLWATRYLSSDAAVPMEIWRRWADDVREVKLDCGHFVAEEEPEACAEALENFFSGRL